MGKPKKLDEDAQRAMETAALERMVHDRMVSRNKPWTPDPALDAYRMGWMVTGIYDAADVAREVQKQFVGRGMTTAYSECDVDGFAVRLTVPRAVFPADFHARTPLDVLHRLPEGKKRDGIAGRL